MTKPPVAPEAPDNSAEVTAALLNAVHELFGDVASSCTLPTSNLTVNFFPAKFRHLDEITQLYSEIVSGLTNSELTSMMKEVSKRQEGLINEGVSPYLTDPTGIVQEVMANGGSLALKLVSGLTGVTPKLAAMFTDLTEEQFKDLELDEVMLVVYAIFARNYNFFTQRLLPLIAVFTVNHQKTRK
jgi:uncharacterized protein YkvS